jgi:spore germination protein (amino acid permease)
MINKNEMISGSMLTYLMIGVLQGSAITLGFVYSITKQNTWLIIITSSIIIIPISLVYTALAYRFPKKNLIQINNIIYGKYLGSFISLLYTMWFIFLIPLNIRFIGDTLVNFLFPETPIIIFILMFTCICAYAVYKDIEVICRCSPIIVMICFMIVIATFLLLIKDMNLHNFLPLYNLSLKEFIQGNHIFISIPFDISVFLMIYSSINNKEDIRRSTLKALLFGILFMLIISIRNTAVLGKLTSISVSSVYDVIGIINIAQLFTRLEAVVVINILISVFLKIVVYYYASVVSIAEIFKLNSYKILILPIGIISINFTIINFNTPLDEVYSASHIYPIFVLPLQILIPILSLCLARIRNL